MFMDALAKSIKGRCTKSFIFLSMYTVTCVNQCIRDNEDRITNNLTWWIFKRFSFATYGDVWFKNWFKHNLINLNINVKRYTTLSDTQTRTLFNFGRIKGRIIFNLKYANTLTVHHALIFKYKHVLLPGTID